MATDDVDRRSGAFKAASVPANYERHLAPIVFEGWAQRLLETLRVKPGDAILDVASGTGVVTRAAARQAGRGGRVVAADVSEAMASAGVEPPFPRAFETASFKMAPDTVASLLDDAGFAEAEVSTVEHQVTWPNAQAAAAGILGTPFGPLVSALPDPERAALFSDLGQRFALPTGPPAVEHITVSVIARAVASPD